MKNINKYIIEKFKISKDINSKIKYNHEFKKGDKILRVIFNIKPSSYVYGIEACPVVEFSSFSKNMTNLYYIENGKKDVWTSMSNTSYKLNSNGIYEYVPDENNRNCIVLFLDKECGLNFIDISIDDNKTYLNKDELEEYLDKKDIKTIDELNLKLLIRNTTEELEKYKKSLLKN